MLVESIILGLLIGYLRGGSLKSLQDLNFKGLYLVILAFLLKASVSFLLVNYNHMINQTHTYLLTLIQYFLLLLFVAINYRYFFILIGGAGFLLNFIAMLANSGSMPLSNNIVEVSKTNPKLDLIIANKFYTYKLIDSNTNLWFLGDIIRMKFPFKRFISIGDIILALGIMLLTQAAMLKQKKENRGKPD